MGKGVYAYVCVMVGSIKIIFMPSYIWRRVRGGPKSNMAHDTVGSHDKD